VKILYQNLSPTSPVVVSPTQTETLGVYLVSAKSERRIIFDQKKLGSSILSGLFDRGHRLLSLLALVY